MSVRPDYKVAILGAGFSGLGMAIHLIKAGRKDFIILEKASDVGGTWRENHYPGCACDVPSHLYSFSFEKKPDWSRMYPPQSEIQSYLQSCAQRYGVHPFIRFGAEVVTMRFDDSADLWRIETKGGQTITARVAVSGMGGLHIPAFPHLKGMDQFAGPAFHSSRWRHGVSLDAKNVAVIGTGASAIQFVPQVATRAARVSVYQRTPPWIMPKLDRSISAREKFMFKHAPVTMEVFRRQIYLMSESRALAFVKKNQGMIEQAENAARAHIETQIAEPSLREKVTPKFRLGCKRVLISNDYYPALTRKNVELITAPIAEIGPASIVTSDGETRRADVMIYATGFQPMAAPADIFGLHGRSLKEDWAAGPEAHLGITVAGYPNLFLLMGPNTGLGHNSMIYMIESQIRYIMESLRAMEERGAQRFVIRSQAQSEFNRHLQTKMERTIWSSGCKSWYLAENGKNSALWPGFTFDYRRRTRRPDLGKFEIV